MSKFTITHGLLVFLLLILPFQLLFVAINSSVLPESSLLNMVESSLGGKSLITTVAASFIASNNERSREPILLRYLIRLIGNDWLGANWIYMGLKPFRYPLLDSNGQQVTHTDPKTGKEVPEWNSIRFWVDPGPVWLKPQDVIWIWGYSAGTHAIYADSIQVNPPSRVAAPVDVSAAGSVLAVSGETITIRDQSGIDYTISVDAYTTYSFPPDVGLPRPQRGLWLNISWLTGANGLLGRFDGYHGDYHGLLRFDFRNP